MKYNELLNWASEPKCLHSFEELCPDETSITLYRCSVCGYTQNEFGKEVK